jgi:hypothetical protein
MQNVYSYCRETGEYLGSTPALTNPGKSGGILIPAFSTVIAPPEAGENQAAVFDAASKTWEIVLDFRGTPYWDADGAPHTIAELGETIPAGASTTPPPPPPPTPEEIQAAFTEQIQRRLDEFVRTIGYDNILSACTYATSTVPKFASDGQYCVEARDATWAAAYAILDDVLSGKRPMPVSIEEIEGELPTLVWPAS